MVASERSHQQKKKYAKPEIQFKLDNKNVTTNKSIISEKFNEFFINIGPNLADKIPPQTAKPLDYLGSSIPTNIFLEIVTVDEFDEITKSLKISAPGHDEVTKNILDLSMPVIKNHLIYLLNQSLQQGVFPDELKIAKITPIYKADDSSKFNNYRPVSVLSIISKIFEKAMYNKLLKFLEKYKILYEKQFGFRKKHSTYMALMILIDNLIKCMENGEYVIGVFLDFSKAFDTVNHSILLSKLSHYGIRGTAYDWFRSYLNNRKQYVSYANVKSSMKTIRCGVPQGSILGPLLFLIYTNDLINVCSKTSPFLFADDTNLFMNGKELPSMINTLNQELQDISLWLKVNKLSLNIKKTHFMVFTRQKTITIPHDICIDGYSIDRVSNTKFLGVYIDDKLNWKKHISYISGKISRGLGIILKARKLLPSPTLKTLYYSFIYPYFSYCNHVWGSACDTYIYPLILLQKRCIRIITRSKYRDPTDPIFKKLELLKLKDINKYAISKFMFNWYHMKLPSLFLNVFTRISNVHSHATRQRSELYCPRVKISLSKMKYTYQAPKLWNKILKVKVNPDTSEMVFCKSIKQCLKVGLL